MAWSGECGAGRPAVDGLHPHPTLANPHACRELLTGGTNLKSRPIEAEDVKRVLDGKVPSDPTVVSQYT